MSDVAKKARAAMKSKAQRLGSSRPLEKVDSSTWTPPELLNAQAKTGMRPVSRRQFKKGGKVMGDCAPTRADRAPRKSGGKAITADSLINRDQKEANEQRDGIKHIGGMKSGGRAKKMIGGPMQGAQNMMDRAAAVSDTPDRLMSFTGVRKGTLSPLKAAGMKKGGSAKHEDVAEDKALIKKMVKPSARTGKKEGGFLRTLGDRVAGDLASDEAMKLKDKVLGGLSGDNYKKGGRTAHAKGGSTWGVAPKMRLLKTHSEGSNSAKVYKNPDTGEHQVKFFKDGVHQPKADYFADEPSDAHETAQYQLKRGFNVGGRTGRATGGQVFSGPGYPGKVPGVVAGGRTARADGGKTKRKGKTDINIVINASKTPGQDMDGMPPMPPGAQPRPPGAMPVAVPPPGAGGPPGMPMGAGAPMPMPPGLAGAGMPPMPPGGMPPMGRKRGGRTMAKSYKDMTAGAGSGEGRLQKTEIAEHKRGERKAGGRTYRSYKDMDAGAGSGLGRLEKTEIAAHKSGIQKA